VPSWPGRGKREREREERDDRRGRTVRESERGRARACEWDARPGVAGPDVSAHASGWAARVAGLSRERRGEAARAVVFAFFQKCE
jgi:hypothetical protein